MKNKNILIIAAVVILLLIGGGAYLSMQQAPVMPQANQPATNDSMTTKQDNNIEEMQSSIKNLLTAGKTIQCTFTTDMNDSNVSGTVYAANGKVRQDYTVKTPDGDMVGHMIADTANVYTWTDSMKQGFKMSISGETPSVAPDNQTADINKSIKFSCQPWNADNSLFNLPPDITFQEFNIPQANQPSSAVTQTGDSSSSTNMCSACDQVPAGAARDSCRTQLGC